MSLATGTLPKTTTLAELSRSLPPGDLAHVMNEVIVAARDAQQQLGEEAARGNQARMADLAACARADCEFLGAAGLARRLGALEQRARRHELVDPLPEVDPVMAELDAFLEALATRPERGRR